MVLKERVQVLIETVHGRCKGSRDIDRRAPSCSLLAAGTVENFQNTSKLEIRYSCDDIGSM